MGWSAWTLAPGHDETITLLNMRNQAIPIPIGIGDILDQRKIFEGPLAQFSDIAPMLKSTDVHPPFYYYTALLVSKMGGESLFALRLLSLVFVSLSCLILTKIAYQISQKTPMVLPFVTIILFSSSPIVYAGISARNYSLLFFLLSFLILQVYWYITDAKSHKTLSITLAITSALAIWTHYFAILPIAAIYLSILIWKVRSKKDIQYFIMSSVLLILMLIPITSWLQAHLHARDNQYSGFQSLFLELMAMLRIFSEQASYLGSKNAAWNIVLLLILGPLIIITTVLSVPFTKTRTSVIFLTSLITSSVLLLGLYFITDKTLGFLDSSRYGIFLTIFIIPLMGLTARKTILPLALIAIIGSGSWISSSHQTDPWLWDNSFATVLPKLQEENTLVVFSSFRRGVEGNIVYRAKKGYIAFQETDIGLVTQNWRDTITQVHMINFDDKKGNLQTNQWANFLSQKGFEKSQENTWTLKNNSSILR
jgi:uncharacterized membrane protein